MRGKSKWLAIFLALVIALGVTACGGSAEYTLDGVNGEIAADFGVSYTAPQYKILKDGVDTGYKAKLSSATDPDGEEVTVSYSSFVLGKQGKYTLTYVSVGLKDAENLKEEKEFVVILNSSDTVGPTVSIITESQFLIWAGKTLTLPTIDARDTSGVKEGSVKLYVESPDKVRTELTAGSFIPKEAGEYKWIAVAEDVLGNKTEKTSPFSVVAAPNEAGNDVIGHFNDPFGAQQITAYNATVDFVEDYVWADGSVGATKFTSEVDQTELTGVNGKPGREMDYAMCFELMAPYINPVTSVYDYLVVPMHNPSSERPITVRAWWWAPVTILPGETIYYAVPSAHFAGGNQQMTAGNYETIYDCERMVFACLDRYESFYTDEEFENVGADYMLPAGTEWYVGPLKAANYNEVPEGEDVVVAELSTLASASYLEPGYYTMMTYRNDDKVKDSARGITGATVYYGDEHSTDGNFSLRYMAFDKEELLEQVGGNDYLYFYAKTVAGENTSENVKISFGNSSESLTDEYKEIRIFRQDLAKMFYSDQYGERMRLTLSAKTPDGHNQLDGLRVAITSIKLHKGADADGDILVYADEYGMSRQISVVGPGGTLSDGSKSNVTHTATASVDTEVTYKQEPSSIKFSASGLTAGSQIAIRFDGATVANIVNNYRYIDIPLYNMDARTGLDPEEAANNMIFELFGNWGKDVWCAPGTWTIYRIDTDKWKDYKTGTDDFKGATLYAWIYYSGEGGFRIGNIRGSNDGREYHTEKLTTAKNSDGSYKYFDVRTGALADGENENTIIFTPDATVTDRYHVIGTRGIDKDGIDVNNITQMRIVFTNLSSEQVALWIWWGQGEGASFSYGINPGDSYEYIVTRDEILNNAEGFGAFCGLWPLEYDDREDSHIYSPLLTSLNGLAVQVAHPDKWNNELPADAKLAVSVEFTYYTQAAEE